MAKFSRQGGWTESIDKDAYRSGLEVLIAKQMEDAGIKSEYEKNHIPYIIPASPHKYNFDWVLENGIIVEGKGRFDISDRKKHLFVKAQYPHLDIRFVFSNPNQTISKASKTRYSDWCNKHGFKYAKKFIPVEWFKEPSRDTTGIVANKRKGEK